MYSRICVAVESSETTRYNSLMSATTSEIYASRSPGIAGFFKSHVAVIMLLAMMLIALPAYLSALEGQFIDMEFLASLCGISGWDSANF